MSNNATADIMGHVFKSIIIVSALILTAAAVATGVILGALIF